MKLPDRYYKYAGIKKQKLIKSARKVMRSIIQRPDPILNQVCAPVARVDGLVKELAKEMIHYLNLPPTEGAISFSVGIAAIQLGEKIRVIAVKRGAEDIIIINPVVVKASLKTHRVVEACFSISNGKALYEVTRHKSVKVVGLDLHGEKVTYKGWDLFGQVLQHEIDHLNGRMIDTHGLAYIATARQPRMPRN